MCDQIWAQSRMKKYQRYLVSSRSYLPLCFPNHIIWGLQKCTHLTDKNSIKEPSIYITRVQWTHNLNKTFIRRSIFVVRPQKPSQFFSFNIVLYQLVSKLLQVYSQQFESVSNFFHVTRQYYVKCFKSFTHFAKWSISKHPENVKQAKGFMSFSGGVKMEYWVKTS